MFPSADPSPAVPRPAARPASRRDRVRPGLAVLVATLLLLAAAAPARAVQLPSLAPDEAMSVASQAAGWLAHSVLQPDGAAHLPGGAPDAATTAWTALSLHATGLDDEARAPTRWLARHIDSLARGSGPTLSRVDSPAGLALLILVARAANRPAERFGRQNLVARLLATRQSDGRFGPRTSGTAMSDPAGGVPSRQGLVLAALAAVGRTDAGAADWLQQLECPDGGWQYDRVDPTAPCAAEAITTGYVMQGLAAVGRGVPPDAIGFLDRLQLSDGGFPLLPGVTDVTATAVALQGLIAAGEDPNTDRWRKGSDAGSATPFTALIQRDTDVGGGFSQQPNDPPDANLTSRVVPGAAGQPLPLAAAAPTGDPGFGPPGSGGNSTDTAGSDSSDSTDTANPAGNADGFSPLLLLGLAAGSSAIVAVIYAFRRRRQAV